MSYSPWLDATNGLTNVGNNLSDVAMNLAMLRARKQKQDEATAFAVERMIAQNALEKEKTRSMVAENDAQAGYYKAKTSTEAALLDAANRAGIAARVRGPQWSMAPTVENARALQIGDLLQHATRAKMLQGGVDPFNTTSVGANAVAFDNLTRQPVMAGPAVLNPGEMYQLGGAAPLVNPEVRPHNIPAGGIAIDPRTGREIANNPRPVTPADDSAQIGNLLRFISGAQAPMTDPETGEPLQNPLLSTPLYTNVLNKANTMIAPTKNPSEAKGKYSSANEVKADFKSGKLSREEALNILKTEFGMK